MAKSFECKFKGRLGTGKDDLKEMRVLNRIVRITPDALLYEADPRHAEMLIQSFQLERLQVGGHTWSPKLSADEQSCR